MSRDGRGTPGRIILKNQPRLRLADVLRRRRTTLKCLMTDLGFTTYAALDGWCARMGVVAPTCEEFEAVFPPHRHVNSPLEGVVVLEAPNVISEQTGDIIELSTPEPADTVFGAPESTSEPTETLQKKRKPKKDGQPIDG